MAKKNLRGLCGYFTNYSPRKGFYLQLSWGGTGSHLDLSTLAAEFNTLIRERRVIIPKGTEIIELTNHEGCVMARWAKYDVPQAHQVSEV